MLNVFTRYDPDPVRRRVTTLPPELGLGEQPTRVVEVPGVHSILDLARQPDFIEAQNPRLALPGQTDPNRHYQWNRMICARWRSTSPTCSMATGS